MRFFESILIALQAIWANKLRSILTLIGMIIGVTTVIAVVSVINGMNSYVADKINTLGSSTFLIDKYGIITSDEEWFKARNRKNITIADMKAIEENCDLCEMVGGDMYGGRMKIKYKSKYLEDIDVVGVTYNYVDISDVELEIGRNFTEEDELRRNAVCMIGPDIAENLFDNESPLGKNIKIGKYFYKIVGVGKKRGSFLGQNQDNWIVAPLATSTKYFSRRRSVEIYAKAKSIAVMEEAQDQARMTLRARRKLSYNDADDFGMYTAESLLNLFNNFVGAAWIVLVLISSISLIVGGIVIMNIMLVSVTERTREIGIRKAIGARRRDILWQFLTEAVTLSLVGGGFGVLLGIGLAVAVENATPLPASIELWAVLSGLAVASSVGLIFGIFPAMKAARLDPIEALRFE
jgi:putative ABC transport system permease protein